MKILTILTATLLSVNLLFAQSNEIYSSFFSESLMDTKMVNVYFPPGYYENPNWHYPVIYFLHGWNGNQNSMNEMIFTMQELINNGTIEPVIMVGADNNCLPFGGSFYVNSIIWGNYEDYMVNDLIDWVDSSFRTIRDRNARALFGHSMGGYGAFRYGILHKDKFCALSSFAGAINRRDPYFIEQYRTRVFQENQPGPAFLYNFYDTGPFTMSYFLSSGAWTPNINSEQIYTNPQIVDFPYDEYGNPIDTIFEKSYLQDIAYLIHQLNPEDNVGILFGCGSNDHWFLYPMNISFKDSLEQIGLPYEFYDCTSDHIMPVGFKQRSFEFIDSLLMSPGVYAGTNQVIPQSLLNIYPNPSSTQITIETSTSMNQGLLKIFSLNGHELKQYQITEPKMVIDISSFPAGVYFVRFTSENDIRMFTVVKY